MSDALKGTAELCGSSACSFQCLIITAVIHQYNFKVMVMVQNVMDFPEQAGDIAGFVLRRNHDRYGCLFGHRGYLGNGDVGKLEPARSQPTP